MGLQMELELFEQMDLQVETRLQMAKEKPLTQQMDLSWVVTPESH